MACLWALDLNAGLGESCPFHGAEEAPCNGGFHAGGCCGQAAWLQQKAATGAGWLQRPVMRHAKTFQTHMERGFKSYRLRLFLSLSRQ